MGIGRLGSTKRRVPALSGMQKRALIITGLILAAVPVTAALSPESVQEPKANATTHSESTAEVQGESVTVPEPKSQTTGGASNTMNTTTTITVNGQDIPVPENGSTTTTVPSENGGTTLNVNTTTNGASNNSSNVQTNVNVQSSATGSQGGYNYSNVYVSQ